MCSSRRQQEKKAGANAMHDLPFSLDLLHVTVSTYSSTFYVAWCLHPMLVCLAGMYDIKIEGSGREEALSCVKSR